MNKTDELAKELEKVLDGMDIGEEHKAEVVKVMLQGKDRHVNLMITGATGSGKSSTINALFNTEKAKVGTSANPETMEIEKYVMSNLTLWDSPGLGDGKEADQRHATNIKNKLREKDADGDYIIDLVLVILDAGSRDLGTSYELINKVIIPNLGENAEKRILVALNQCDMALKGRHWDDETSKPEEKLIAFLDEKVESVRERIKRDTGIDVKPIYYSAGFKEEGEAQCKPYNLSKLLYFIVEYAPQEKRLALVDNINNDESMWESDDELEDYKEKTRQSVVNGMIVCATGGAALGGTIGMAVGGPVGAAIGTVAGAVIGGAVRLGASIFKW